MSHNKYFVYFVYNVKYYHQWYQSEELHSADVTQSSQSQGAGRCCRY